MLHMSGNEIMSDQQWMTPEEIAEEMRVSASTVRRLCNSGALEGVKFGEQWRVRKRAYETYLLSHANQKRHVSEAGTL